MRSRIKSSSCGVITGKDVGRYRGALHALESRLSMSVLFYRGKQRATSVSPRKTDRILFGSRCAPVTGRPFIAGKTETGANERASERADGRTDGVR